MILLRLSNQSLGYYIVTDNLVMLTLEKENGRPLSTDNVNVSCGPPSHSKSAMEYASLLSHFPRILTSSAGILAQSHLCLLSGGGDLCE